MKEVLIERFETSEQGTFGKLYNPDFFCFTGEPPWRDNRPNISCIPVGIYEVKIRKSSKYGITYWITNVPDRMWILQHSGNVCGDKSLGYRTHTYGCQLLGKYVGVLEGQKAVLYSKPTVNKFMDVMGYEDYTLTIREEYCGNIR